MKAGAGWMRVAENREQWRALRETCLRVADNDDMIFYTILEGYVFQAKL